MHNTYFFFIVPDGSFWDFTSDLAKGDTAYTTLALGAHTDTTYLVRTPIPLLESVFSYNLILLLPFPLPSPFVLSYCISETSRPTHAVSNYFTSLNIQMVMEAKHS